MSPTPPAQTDHQPTVNSGSKVVPLRTGMTPEQRKGATEAAARDKHLKVLLKRAAEIHWD